MIVLESREVTDALRSLFNPNVPAALRIFAVLNGDIRGIILTDNAAEPTWGVVQEKADNTIYLSGSVPPAVLGEVVNHLRREGEVLMGAWLDEEWPAGLPSDHYYTGRVLEFVDRPADMPLPPIPAGCQLRPMDAELLPRTIWYEDTVNSYGSAAAFLEKGLGLCLLRGDEILCEASTGPAVTGLIELGVITAEPHRRQGYAYLTCAHLAHLCEQRGYQTYWNCAKQNVASEAVARKLGYQTEREYQLVAWHQAKEK
jgi:RimJ/RimL family protein N-acetyltransferase